MCSFQHIKEIYVKLRINSVQKKKTNQYKPLNEMLERFKQTERKFNCKI